MVLVECIKNQQNIFGIQPLSLNYRNLLEIFCTPEIPQLLRKTISRRVSCNSSTFLLIQNRFDSWPQYLKKGFYVEIRFISHKLSVSIFKNETLRMVEVSRDYRSQSLFVYPLLYFDACWHSHLTQLHCL